MDIFSSFENQWILSQCAHAVIAIDQHWQNRDFHLLNRSIRHFLYSCLCDVYVESVKRVLNEPQHPEFDDTLRTLYVCITTGLRLLHPLMPFLTEELYQRINAAFEVTCSSISTESYPTPSEVSSQLYISDNNCSSFLLFFLACHLHPFLKSKNMATCSGEDEGAWRHMAWEVQCTLCPDLMKIFF